jgi:uncharacterized protein involved in cysteine biosynthesis
MEAVSDVTDQKGCDFSIRAAKWVSRLSAFEQNIEKLAIIASYYVMLEQTFELIGEPFNSLVPDKMLMGLLPPIDTEGGVFANLFRPGTRWVVESYNRLEDIK